MQFYLYDFTRYLDIDVDEQGVFPEYPGLEEYYAGGEKLAFIIRSRRRPAGFALMERLEEREEGDYYMTEFFVLQKYRRSGVGSWAARQLFKEFQGKWKVTQLGTNLPALAFWRQVISEYTDGKFEEKVHLEQGHISQYFVSS
ncbi:GNAT family N-acetyltransferase [Paenibacillus lacisoli]